MNEAERAFPDDETAWSAVKRRDRAFDGRFVTGVHSTGIYCRPSCAARHPARHNVKFYSDADAAEAAGLRACKRCAPRDVARDEAAVLGAIEAIKASESALGLAALAEQAGYSPSHFQRVFTRITGLSPAAYSRALREERARTSLASEGSVTEAIFAAGYSAPSRFYEEMEGRLGMSASEWNDGGRGRTVHWDVIKTSLGKMLVAATEKGVCCVSFGEEEEHLRARFPKAELVKADEDFAALFGKVVAAVERPGTAENIPLDVKGTAFQQRVWEALRAIPPGKTRSYGELAAALGSPKASRAVGGANGANNIAVLIPCHRVIAANGTLGGYAYGTAIKEELLKRERSE
ncbi:bifunctional DNA-binding transcriptional regulator/O6-methylguanine-DNA methyltransferase Ada [Qipengyuania atrilutea]|uniref:methylated-DNA--[protein]-cysteine S-methyltransferase n=1 Tax=Qipengyuania atrilutea TaxID=2744473 RepID=A0A850GYT2_9SPHN|nr:bifunctional DNA-binding transcriptional regulator/O6-methylguanine-DNA methyltransferase Ada [Actirhodobacter atriluteus]NVD43646.1 bifunctional DNA-binding transcriptional regulator/O6-methylguanine-DNA methyltransferase Ada [Actirhodobacter atriluteus]